MGSAKSTVCSVRDERASLSERCCEHGRHEKDSQNDLMMGRGDSLFSSADLNDICSPRCCKQLSSNFDRTSRKFMKEAVSIHIGHNY